MDGGARISTSARRARRRVRNDACVRCGGEWEGDWRIVGSGCVLGWGRRGGGGRAVDWRAHKPFVGTGVRERRGVAGGVGAGGGGIVWERSEAAICLRERRRRMAKCFLSEGGVERSHFRSKKPADIPSATPPNTTAPTEQVPAEKREKKEVSKRSPKRSPILLRTSSKWSS